MYSKMKEAGYFNNFKAYGSGHSQVFTHAEAYTLLKAFETYGSELGKRVTIFCDRHTCGICQKNLGSIKEFLELEELIVINKDGSKFVF